MAFRQVIYKWLIKAKSNIKCLLWSLRVSPNMACSNGIAQICSIIHLLAIQRCGCPRMYILPAITSGHCALPAPVNFLWLSSVCCRSGVISHTGVTLPGGQDYTCLGGPIVRSTAGLPPTMTLKPTTQQDELLRGRWAEVVVRKQHCFLLHPAQLQPQWRFFLSILLTLKLNYTPCTVADTVSLCDWNVVHGANEMR